ncbi:MAG: UDP-N-acetylmuramoyl-tripeptide--D-alanyl-D-alanine ligase [Coriobacteriales bacterium]|jgi:UDP-N-acetylmuramoyl-tripeptide--D-alanyl-D-alanine ligase|nr:UDP-N-acetylmuramoyl-tripeptide--D-alanyl-D-alanine ligase [Coriobacteriales bacterium]
MRLTIAQIIEFSRALTVVPARDQQQVIQRLTWDSRNVQPDMLFVALPGERVDGNEFIVEAFERGAAVVIASRQVTEAERRVAQQYRAALLYATDAQLALWRLASAWRESLDAKVIGITGSSGKTSTRALVSAVLERAFLTVSSIGNRNNEIGLPATVLSASSSTEMLVVEMAMRGLGQIEELAAIARPHIGVVTKIGPVHLELLGSKDNVARAKAEMISALPDGSGIAILNGDDPYTPRIRELARTFEREIRVLLFGLGAHNDIRAAALDFDEEGQPSFDLWLRDGQPRRVHLKLRGEHSVYNALAAAATAVSLGVESRHIVAALEQAQPAPMRQVFSELEDGSLLIDDSYNANPDSMRAALEMLGRLPNDRPHIAVLGDMGELGVEAVDLHERIGRTAFLNNTDVLVTVGALARSYAQGALESGMGAERVIICADSEEALAALALLRADKPIMLVKGSRFMELDRLVALLKENGQPNGQPSTPPASDDGRPPIPAEAEAIG